MGAAGLRRPTGRVTALAFGLFALLTTTLVAHHQPWRDEADAWLMARDASVGELFHYAGYSGTPVLWYLIQVPFAKAGAAYATQRYLHLAIALAAVGLLLFRAPFPLPLRMALVFGYFFSFEYAVVARNYSSGILLCFAAVARPPAFPPCPRLRPCHWARREYERPFHVVRSGAPDPVLVGRVDARSGGAPLAWRGAWRYGCRPRSVAATTAAGRAVATRDLDDVRARVLPRHASASIRAGL